MEYLIVGVIKLPENATDKDIARYEARIVDSLRLDDIHFFNGDRMPLCYWSFHKLDVPMPLRFRSEIDE